MSAALETFRLETGRQPYMLGGWDVEDDAIGPPEALEDKLCAIPPRPREYAYARAFSRARERAAEVFCSSVRFADAPVGPENVNILHSSTQALMLALAALKERGVRRVVVAAPAYFAAIDACKVLGCEVVVVPAADYLTGALDLDGLLRALRVPDSALLVTNPAYSIGVQHRAAKLRRLFAEMPTGTWVLLDETRLGLHWRDASPWYAGNFPERTLIVRSPSKVFFTNGLKTSLLFGPADVLRSIERLGESLVGSAAGNAEDVALAYLDAWSAWESEARTAKPGPLLAWRERVVGRLSANLAAVRRTLDEYGVVCSSVDSGPHVLAALPRTRLVGLDAAELARREGVQLMLSSHFFHESDEWSGFRINLCGDAARTDAALLRVFERLGRPGRARDYAAVTIP